jgi:hypothetical protein
MPERKIPLTVKDIDVKPCGIRGASTGCFAIIREYRLSATPNTIPIPTKPTSSQTEATERKSVLVREGMSKKPRTTPIETTSTPAKVNALVVTVDWSVSMESILSCRNRTQSP